MSEEQLTQNIDFETGLKLLIAEMDRSYSELKKLCESEYLQSVSDEKVIVERIVRTVDKIHDLKSSWKMLLSIQSERARNN